MGLFLGFRGGVVQGAVLGVRFLVRGTVLVGLAGVCGAVTGMRSEVGGDVLCVHGLAGCCKVRRHMLGVGGMVGSTVLCRGCTVCGDVLLMCAGFCLRLRRRLRCGGGWIRHLCNGAGGGDGEYAGVQDFCFHGRFQEGRWRGC